LISPAAVTLVLPSRSAISASDRFSGQRSRTAFGDAGLVLAAHGALAGRGLAGVEHLAQRRGVAVAGPRGSSRVAGASSCVARSIRDRCKTEGA
jgi:hypothetical protein